MQIDDLKVNEDSYILIDIECMSTDTIDWYHIFQTEHEAKEFIIQDYKEGGIEDTLEEFIKNHYMIIHGKRMRLTEN